MTKKPIKLVMVRRGAITIPNVPTQKLKAFIRKRALLGTDEISGDGKNWVRVDHHYQLRKFIAYEDCQKNVVKTKNDLSNEDKKFESLPDLEYNFQEVANLLWDINK